jgi:protein-disulfide isomerase
MITRLVTLVVVVAAAAGVAYAADPLSKEQIEQIVREYLQKNPEIVVDALRAAQAKQREAQREKQLQAITKHREELLRDSASPVGGNVAGDVTVVEFFDYACPHCKNVTPQVKQLLREDPKVRFVYKELPVLGEASTTAARAALAAREQNKYFAFHDVLMAASGALNEAVIFRVAGEVGLDVGRLKTDMASTPVTEALEKNRALAQALGVNGTPAFVIGNDLAPGMAPGAVSIARLKEMVAKARQGSR